VREGERLVVVGGGPAGLSTARAYRDAGGRAALTLLSAEEHPPYQRPPLTKEFLRGEQQRADLWLEDEQWYVDNGVDLRLGTRAEGLDLHRGVVRAGSREHPFDACVLATGSRPKRPPFPGGDDPGLLTMRTLDDSERLRASAGPQDAVVVIGAGFIGCEAAASLAMRGAAVTLVAPESVPLEPRLGQRAGARLAGWLEEAGVALRLEAQVESISRVGPWEVALAGGERLRAAAVVAATGVAPRMELPRAAGLHEEQGAVAVDARMRCGDERVLAVGDVAAAQHASAGRRLRVEHWGDALVHGEVAGRTLAGEDAAWREPPGFWSTIGERTIKHAAWGDGHDEAIVEVDEPDRLVVRYRRGGAEVGVLAHNDDEAYEGSRDALRAAGSAR